MPPLHLAPTPLHYKGEGEGNLHLPKGDGKEAALWEKFVFVAA